MQQSPLELTKFTLPRIEKLRKMIPSTKKVLCHLDLHHRNILVTKKSLFLIDWENAAIADPYCDLASTSSIENFTDREMEKLLQLYVKRKCSQSEKNHLFALRILSDVRWALWSLLQTKISPIEGPYVEQAQEFLQHALDRIEGNKYA